MKKGYLEKEPLVKILGEFSNEDGTPSMEGLRAVSLGNELYEIRNIPIFTPYHLFDTVRCQEYPNEDHCPVIRQLVTSGGHQTIGITFTESATLDQQVDVVYALVQKFPGLLFEHVAEMRCAISFLATDYENICKWLDSYQDQKVIFEYEKLE